MLNEEDRDIFVPFAATFTGRHRRVAIATAALWLVAAGTAGCAGEKEFRNVGKLCLYPASESQGIPGSPLQTGDNMTSRTYPAGQPVNVAVHFPTCLSHNCSVDRKTSCSAAFEAGSDQRLVVDSFGSFEEKTQSACATDCGNLIARCSTPPLAAGTYVFEHGGASVTLTVPFSGPPPCVNAQGP